MFRFKFVRSSFAFSEIIPELANFPNERMNLAWLKPMLRLTSTPQRRNLVGKVDCEMTSQAGRLEGQSTLKSVADWRDRLEGQSTLKSVAMDPG